MVGDAPVSIAIRIEDPALAACLRAILQDVPGLRLVGAEMSADATLVAPRPPAPLLTQRESEVLALLAEGASNKIVARRLGISAHTVKFHVASLLDKLDAVGRTDAVAHAARLGVIQL
jgi:DNA-binding CsgD family transcriptional regulator